MKIEGFVEKLQVRANTIYQRMDELVGLSDAPDDVKVLRLTRQEKVALAAIELFDQEWSVLLGREDWYFEPVENELRNRYRLVRESKSPYYKSGNEKVSKLVEVIRNG